MQLMAAKRHFAGEYGTLLVLARDRILPQTLFLVRTYTSLSIFALKTECLRCHRDIVTGMLHHFTCQS